MVIENPLMPPRLGMGTTPNVVPFTMRENFAQMGLVEGMRHWITTDLIPFINDNIDKLNAGWVEQVNTLIDQFEVITIGLVTDVNEAVAEIGSSVTDAQAAQVAAEAARDLAEQFASQAQDVQDASVSVIVNDADSQLRTALEGLFAPLAGYTTMFDTVNTGRLSAGTLTTRFDEKADKTAVDAKNQSQDTAISAATTLAASKADAAIQATVESGRLSPEQMEATWATKTAQEAIAAEVANVPKDGMPILIAGKKFRTVACSIRNTGAGGWQLIADDNHTPVGVAAVSQTATYIQVTFNYTGARAVVSSITPDETFAKAAVRIGASLGISFVRIYIYSGAAYSEPLNPSQVATPGSASDGANIWIYILTEVD